MITTSLTLFEVLSLIISVAGFLVIVRSLAMTRRQTKEMTDTLKAAAHQADTAHMLAVDALFVNQPDLRPYFYSQKEVDRDHPDYDKVQAMAGLLLDYFGAIAYQRPHIPQIYPNTWWDPYFINMFANSPMLCAYLEEHEEYYPILLSFKRTGENKRSEQTLQNSTLTLVG